MPLFEGFSHTGGIGGLLAGTTWRNNYDQAQADLAKKAFDLEKDRYDFASQLDVEVKLQNAEAELADIANPSDRAIRIAEIATPSKPAAAVEMLSKAAQMQEHEAKTASEKLETAISESNAAAGMLESVTDGPSLEALFERTQMQGIDTKGVIPGLYQHYKTKGWDADLEKGLRMARVSITSAKDKAAIALDTVRADTEAFRQKEINARIDLLRAQTTQEQERTKNLTKTGGVTTKAEKVNVVYAANLLKSRLELEDEPAIAGLLAEKVAARANEILAKSPGMKPDVALDRAFRLMKMEREFVGLEARPAMVGSKFNPAPLPIGEDGKIDPKQLKPNTIYGGMGEYLGKPIMWNGTGFDEVPLGGE